MVLLLKCSITPIPKLQKVTPDADNLQVTHFHYTAWPDHGVPQSATSILSFVRRVQKAHDKGKGFPLLVHCTAGVGRTGTFIALDTLLDRMRSETFISVFEVVKDMRKRRVFMVQTLVGCVSLFFLQHT